RAGDARDDQPDGSGRARRDRAPAAAGPPEPRHASQCRTLCGDAGWHGLARKRGGHQGRGAYGRIPRRGLRRQGARRRRKARARRRERRTLRSTGPTQTGKMSSNKPRLCFIGFGEAGQAIASGLREIGVKQIAAWDILFPNERGAPLKRAGEKIGARLASSAADAVANSDIIVSAVTAGSSIDAAQSVAPHLSGNPYFLDVNSVSPGRKKKAAQVLGSGARFVDVAILAPIHPKKHQTPLLLAGEHAQSVLPILIDELDMRGAIASDQIGAAAALKMIRSVMIKGIEALTAECFLAAQRAGIAEEVAVSLHNNYPTLNWDKVISYNLERMASHGIRRAEEMEQVAATLIELGIAPLMTQAAVTRQREMGELGKGDPVRAAKREGGA